MLEDWDEELCNEEEKRQTYHKQITCIPWLGIFKKTSVAVEITSFISYLH